MMIRGGTSADKSVNAKAAAPEPEKINSNLASLKSPNGTSRMEYTYGFLMRCLLFSKGAFVS